MEVADGGVARTTGRREPGPVRGFCLAILGGAIGTGCVLTAAGASLPAPAPVFLLALAIALCINRFALFPSEQAATAEAAVLLAAVVGFRHDAVFLGPLAVALLVGPLDMLHWEQRSYLRMAYNAGNRGLAVVAASAGFVVVRDLAGVEPRAVALALAVGVATVCFAAVDLLLSVALLLLQGESRRAAAHHVLGIDALTLPVALYGAAVGFLAGAVGWWATALALVPSAFVPELVLARARWRATVVRDVVLGLAMVALLVAVAAVAPVPDPATLAVLVAIAVLAGAELAADSRAAVPPLLAVVVVAAIVVADGDGAYCAGALVAVTGTAMAWWGTGRRSRPRFAGAMATAAGAGLLAAAVYEAAPHSVAGAALIALASGLTFELLAVLVGAARRRRGVHVVWTAPLLAGAVAASFGWQVVGHGGSTLFALMVTATFAVAVWWGAPPWRSRVLARWTRDRAPRAHSVVLALTCATATAIVAVGTVTDPASTRLALAWVGAGVGESAVTMALFGVRQWRFAPRPRALGVAALLATAGVLVVVVPTLTVEGSLWAVTLMVVVMVGVLVVGRVPAARAREAADARVPVRHG